MSDTEAFQDDPEIMDELASYAPPENTNGAGLISEAAIVRNLDLPVIHAADQDLDRATKIAWDALKKANDPAYMFMHGGPARLEFDENENPILRPLNETRLRFELARCAKYQVTLKDPVGKGIGTKPAHPPIAVCKNMLAAPNPPLPKLTRIVETPVYGPDGSLQIEPGYHRASSTYFVSKGLNLACVPTNPTQNDLFRARTLIDIDLLGDFPFASDHEKSNAVALFLLPYVRDMIAGPTPLHLIDKPCQGTGATLLADAISYPAIGRSIAATTEGRDEDEWRKRLTAKLATGPAFILFDNLRRRLDSSNVSAAITSLSWEDRLLGYSETIQVPVRCAWIATGNNVSLSGEMARRTVRIRLDAKTDQPWLRAQFKHSDLRAWIKDHRADLVWSALVLVRLWISKGKPKASDKIQRLGSFECWAEILGGILETAEYKGFLANIQEFYGESDIESSTWRGFVEAWWNKYGASEVGSSDLYELAPDLELGKGSERSQKTRLGTLLGNMRDRQFGNFRIIRGRRRQGAQLYRLLEA